MRLYLLRHAEAFPGLPDAARELTPNGESTCERLGQFLRGKKTFRPKRVRHSGLVRAEQTAEIVMRESGLSPRLKLDAWPGLSPADPIEEVHERLRIEREDLLLVGHNPHLTLLASRLLSGRARFGRSVLMKKGALLCLEREDWGTAVDGEPVWVLRWMVTPALLRESP